jgi:hypothetical protein
VSDITIHAIDAFNEPADSLQAANSQSLPTPTAKRERAGTLLTDRLCETRVTKRVKYYDRRCRVTSHLRKVFSCAHCSRVAPIRGQRVASLRKS